MTGAAAVVRLETLVDIVDRADEGTVSFSALHQAVLADGRRLVLLDDRGWTSSVRPPGAAPAIPSVEEIEHTARFVVGPDEPFGERSQEDMGRDHWAALAAVLGREEAVDARELSRLPHDVVLSRRLLALAPG